MIRRIPLLLLALALAGCTSGPVHPRDLPTPAPLVFMPEPIAPVLLKNGAKLFVAEDASVPLVSVTLYLRTGVLDEPAAKAGLADMTGDAMLSGGAGDWSAEALEERMESLGASLGGGISQDMGTLSLRCRSRDLDQGLSILAAVLLSPRFEEERVSLLREQKLEGIHRRKDDPSRLASEVFQKLLYGQDSPWARQETEASVQSLTRDDLLAFHRDRVLPRLWSVAVSGDVRRETLTAKLETAFGGLARSAEFPAAPPVPGLQPRRTVLVAKPLNQATVLLGHAGLPNLVDGKPNPDRYAMQVLNYVLGAGGFTSRLFQEVRTTRGLAYSVWSGFPMENARGSIQMGCQTRTEKAAEALACMREVLSGLVAGGPSSQELALAKESMVNAFVFKVSTPAARVANAAAYDYAGFPTDYLSRYVERIRAVTPEDVARVARTHCHPARMSVAVCGDRAALEPVLASGGAKVEVQEP